MSVVLVLNAHLEPNVWLMLRLLFQPFLQGLVEDVVTQGGALGPI